MKRLLRFIPENWLATIVLRYFGFFKIPLLLSLKKKTMAVMTFNKQEEGKHR